MALLLDEPMLRKLTNEGKTINQIARAMGRSEKWLRSLIPQDLKQQLAEQGRRNQASARKGLQHARCSG
jgi:hypothetical protein